MTGKIIRPTIIKIFCVAAAALSIWSVPSSAGEAKDAGKPRIIATTDGEIDDRCSMVRFLLYTNEWDIEGIIYSSSEFHWKGHEWAGETWIEEDIDRYASFYENLKKHDSDFPSPEELKKLVYVGNIDDVGKMEKDTDGSDRIVEVLLDDKPGPVYLQAWGGTNTIARALWKIQHKFPKQMERVSEKAVIYIILDQDETFREYIQPNWPDLQVLGSFRQFATVAYDWEEIIPEEQRQYYDADWMKKNILNNHGPLCSRYEAHDDGRFRSEGDTPSFWHQIDVGLGSLEHPSYGGWGGRFVKEKNTKNVWRGARDDGSWSKPLWRWSRAFQNDWAARADWCVKSYKEANHPPFATVLPETNLNAAAGSGVQLNAKGWKDTDGDKLRYKWWHYKEPSLYKGGINIRNADTDHAYFNVPKDVKEGQTIHIICEVTDNGNPPLTRYRRVIVELDSDKK